MSFGLIEITLLVGSAASIVAGAGAAVARRRSGALLAWNALFAVVFAFFAVQGLRFGSAFGVALGLLTLAHAAVASAIVGRAASKLPAV